MNDRAHDDGRSSSSDVHHRSSLTC
jgi:hypothetical protein